MAKEKNDYVYSQFYAPHLDPKKGTMRDAPHKNLKLMTYNMFYRVLTELSANRFKWENLPDSVDERYLELGLMRRGAMLFYNHDAMSDVMGERYLVSQFAGVGNVNHYDNPTEFQVITTGGISYPRHLTPHEAVPIWNNYLRMNESDVIVLYSSLLAELNVTLNVNTQNMRRPRAIAMNEDSKLSMENFDRQFSEGVPVIKYNAASSIVTDVSALDLGQHHETIPALLASRGKVWNEALMMLGVAVVNQDKKERMITDEADTAKDQSLVIRNIALNSRKQAVEQINNMFGLNISVSWRAEDDEQKLHTQYGFNDMPEDERDDDVNVHDETA